ncbi:uncharacterized protein G2W53_044821 [Senna tora]|uniref:Uncharacterized protein n=1 Tax=Senna tora TaxID=362788 RepID=A0A834SF50_9FABA|nr:uncharacterized protein G2W53_044821 [Senna tora]
MTHACPLVMRVVPWREALGRGTSAKSHVQMLSQNDPHHTRNPPEKFQGHPSRSTEWIASIKINESWAKSHVHVMGQNEAYDTRKPPKKFKAIRVGRPVVDHVDRRPPKINHPWEASREVSRPSESVAARSTTWIASTKINESWCELFFYAKSHVHMMGQDEAYDTRKPPKKFQGNRLARGQIIDGRRHGSPSVAVHPKSITHGSTFFLGRISSAYAESNDPYDTRKPPKKFQGHPSRSPGGRPRGSPSTQINHPWVNFFSRQEYHVHVMGQNEAYDTRKPPKKFQGNTTCAAANLRWTPTWIAVHPKSITPWVNFFSRQNLRTESHVHMLSQMTPYGHKESLPRSFKAIRVGRPGGRHGDRRHPKSITHGFWSGLED